MAKSKSKRDPKSKPKNKSHILNEAMFNQDETTPHEIKQRKQRRENIFYTSIIILFALMFIGIPTMSFLGGSDRPSDPLSEPPAVSSTPNVDLQSGVDGHISDGNVDPSEVEESDYDKALKEDTQQ